MNQRGKRTFISGLNVMFVVAVFGLLLSGCSSITGYSVSSYQGPLPMGDYRWLEQQSDPARSSTVPPPSVPDRTVRR